MDATRRAAVKLALDDKVIIEQRKQHLDAADWDANGRPGIIRVRLKAADKT